MKYDYPITNSIIEALKVEYRTEAIDKGNSWREMAIIEGKEATHWLCTNKLSEEYFEIEQLINRYHFNVVPKGLLKSELIDLILVACMCYERLDKE